MTPLSLSEAWEYAARLWDAPIIDDIGEAYVVPGLPFGYDYACGLCTTLRGMKERKLITAQQRRKMLKAIPCHGDEFAWPTDLSGAKQRAAFCREQAQKAAA